MVSSAGIFVIAALATMGIIARPGGLPEYVFALAGAVCLVLSGFLPLPLAGQAVLRGMDVYLFLTGMMLLSECARQEGLFDWTAAQAVRAAHGSPVRLFWLVYCAGTVITVFLSNDATAVVLTPAVYAATRAAKVEPLPYLYICAFIASAASFVLPVSNPANLVMFGQAMPPLGQWLKIFALPSVVSVVVTYGVLRWTQRRYLQQPIMVQLADVPLQAAGKISAAGLGLTCAALLVASGLGLDLGMPTFTCGFLVTIVVLIITRRSPKSVVADISWGVLPMVAGLFVLVEGLAQSGAIEMIAIHLRLHMTQNLRETALVSGMITGILTNIGNNLPLGLIAASVSQAASAPAHVTAGLMIGIDLGPNLSVTGSLATLLWIMAIRREGENVSGWRFFKLGLLVMPPALLASLLALVIL